MKHLLHTLVLFKLRNSQAKSSPLGTEVPKGEVPGAGVSGLRTGVCLALNPALLQLGREERFRFPLGMGS